jgi:hypothetical protein
MSTPTLAERGARCRELLDELTTEMQAMKDAGVNVYVSISTLRQGRTFFYPSSILTFFAERVSRETF